VAAVWGHSMLAGYQPNLKIWMWGDMLEQWQNSTATSCILFMSRTVKELTPVLRVHVSSGDICPSLMIKPNCFKDNRLKYESLVHAC
jgi:hypothetical protein